MYEEILVTKNNYKDIFNSYEYGTKIITYENEEVRILFNHRIDIINEFTGNFTMEEKKHVIDDVVDGSWVSTEVPNKYQVLYKNHKELLPIIDESNYNIEELAALSKKESIVCVINNLESNLIKYAKKIANKYNVKFTGNGFNGSIKAVSVRKQIEEAYLSGKYNISFPSSDFNPQTIRNYVSNFSNLIGKKIRVELKLGSIIIHFKNPEESNALFSLIKESHERLKLLVDNSEIDAFLKNLIIKNDLNIDNFKDEKQTVKTTYNANEDIVLPPIALGRKLYGKPVSEEEYRSAAHWQRCGFASEYNWENGIEGDVDMYPKDVRMEGYNEDDDAPEPTQFDWDSLDKEDEDETDDF